MANTMIKNAFIEDKPTFNKLLPNQEAIASMQPRVEDKKKKRFGRFLVNVATSKKTYDFMIGAGVSAAISTSTRMGVLGAAGVLGVSMLPATLIAAGSAGAAVGAYRLYKDYKAEKAAGTWEGWTFKKSAGKLLMSTMLSTIGGGAGYMVLNHGDVIAEYAGKMTSAVVDVLRGAGVIDAAAKTFDSVRNYGAAALNWSLPGSTEALSSIGRKIAEGGAAMAASVGTYDYVGKVASTFESVKGTLKGWGASIKALYSPPAKSEIVVSAQPIVPTLPKEEILALNNIPVMQNEIVIPAPPVLSPLTSEDILAQSQPPAVETDPFEPRVVKTSIVLADGTIITPEEQALKKAAEQAKLIAEFDPRRISDAFENVVATQKPTIPELGIYPQTALAFAAAPGDAVENAAAAVYAIGSVSPDVTAAIDPVQQSANTIVADTFAKLKFPESAANPALNAYIPELGVYPQATTLQFPEMPAGAIDTAKIYSLGDVSPEMTSSIDPSQGYVVAADVTPVLPPATFADAFGTKFEGMDLSRRAERAVEAAMNGSDQQRKDLAMNILNGNAGFKKDPELAASIYKFLLEDTKPAAGEKASQTHLQVVRDTAYLMFYGKGMAADPETAKGLLEEISPRSKVARDMLAEWNGEKVQRTVTAATKETVTKAAAAGTGGLNCEFISAGNRVVAGSCEFKGEMPLKVGDKISLNP